MIIEDEVLPTSWTWMSMEELIGSDAPIIYGIIQPGPDVLEGVPYVRPTEIVDGQIDVSALRRTTASIAKKYSRATLKAGDVLLSIVGTIGKVAIVPPALDGANITQCSARLRPPSSLLLGGFLAAALKSPTLRGQYEKAAFGVAVRRLNIAHVRELQFPLPPLPEQHRIVAKLEALTAKSRRAKEALDAIPPLLERFRQSVLASAFRGDLTAEWRAKNPDVEPADKLLQRIRAERRRRWEESELAKMQAKGKKPGDDRWKEKYEEPEPRDPGELAELPEGWAWATWQEIGSCQNGRAYPSGEYANEGTRLLRPGNLHVSGQVTWTDLNTKHMPEAWAMEYPEHVVHGNELVINLTAQSLKDEFLGRVCLTRDGERCLLNQRIGRLTPIEISSRFCLWLFKSPAFRKYVDGLNTGSLIQHMFTSQVDVFTLPIPPAAEQQEIVRQIDGLLTKSARLARLTCEARDTLGSIDASILAKAFRGELVPQDPTDEPASVLLDRIRRERAAAELAKDKKAPKRSR